MHITQDLLIKLANDHLARRLRQSNDIVAVYLTGSVLTESPLIGGTTDIDLVFVHKENPDTPREIQRVSYEISLDIQHHHQSFYTFHRRLRLNPWLGFALTNHSSILYDPDHWLDFIQAGVSSQFLNPETIYGRAQSFSEKSRSEWFDLEDQQDIPFTTWIGQFLHAVGTATNSIASLNGPALTTRRFMLDFPARAEAINQLSLSGDLARLIGNEMISPEIYSEWRSAWEESLFSASQSPNCPPNLHKARKGYFLSSSDALAEKGSVHAALWIMLETWRQAAAVLENDQAQQETWLKFLDILGFKPERKIELSSQLDHFIEQTEIILEEWKNNFGI